MHFSSVVQFDSTLTHGERLVFAAVGLHATLCTSPTHTSCARATCTSKSTKNMQRKMRQTQQKNPQKLRQTEMKTDTEEDSKQGPYKPDQTGNFSGILDCSQSSIPLKICWEPKWNTYFVGRLQVERSITWDHSFFVLIFCSTQIENCGLCWKNVIWKKQ